MQFLIQLCMVMCGISQHLGSREQRTEDYRLAWATEGDPAPNKNKPPNPQQNVQYYVQYISIPYLQIIGDYAFTILFFYCYFTVNGLL